MRTVHTYTLSQQQQQEQQQQTTLTSASSSSSATNQTNIPSHSSVNGYQSVRHSLLRMHSQLRSAPNRRESNQGPIDLSLYRTSQQAPKMTTRSTSTTTTTLRPIPISTPLVTTPTHTIYNNILTSSSSSTASQTATSAINHERFTKIQHSLSTSDIPKCSSPTHLRPSTSSSPKLAYSYSNIEENLQCPLCIDRLRDPRALPCQHVFCCSCLKSIPTSNLPYSTISCPLCRRTFPYNGAEQFPVSYIHRQLLELIPKNYDINGKCTKCQEKTSLILCSCCDFLLCQKCFSNDRQKILDNIEHITQTCRYRLTRIDTTHNQILKLNESNRKKIQQIENIYENFEKKYTEYKQHLLNSLQKYNEDIHHVFWSKLNIPTETATDSYNNLLNQADSILKKSHTIQFDDILSVFYNLTSVNEQLEQASTSLDTYDIQNLLKQTIQINFDEQISIQLNEIDNTEKHFQLIPQSILPRSLKRLRKTEPKRHIEQIDDDDEDEHEQNSNQEDFSILKRMKIEDHNEMNFDSVSSPTNSVLCSNFFINDQQQQQQQQTDNDDNNNNPNDDDIIYVGHFQTKSPVTPNFEELLQIISTNE